MKNKEKLTYAKPVIKKEEQMTFPLQIIKCQYPHLTCRQCSSCHGCR